MIKQLVLAAGIALVGSLAVAQDYQKICNSWGELTAAMASDRDAGVSPDVVWMKLGVSGVSPGLAERLMSIVFREHVNLSPEEILVVVRNICLVETMGDPT